MIRKELPVHLLLLSDDNPRLDKSFGEDDAIAKMIDNQNDKLIELTKDICQFGINPLETIGVYPSEQYEGYYEVGEGNRRICALKLLNDPERIAEVNPGIYSKIKDLSNNFSAPDSIEVCIFKNETEIRHWMEVRHMGEQNGKGLSKWNSVQKSRFMRMQTGSDALLDFWDWMIEKGILTDQEIKGVTKTNWQRILREKYYPFLKLIFDQKYLVLDSDIPVFMERIRCIQKHLKGQTVAIVYDQAKIDEFYNTISKELYGLSYLDVIEKDTPLDSGSDLDDGSVIENTNNIGSLLDGNNSTSNQQGLEQIDDTTNNTNENNNQNRPHRDVFNNSLTIIPYGYKIRTSNMRLNKIIMELKKLNPDEYPNACGTILRALFELSAKVFLENSTGEDHTAVEFNQAIKKAADLLRNQRRLSNDQHSSIIQERDNLRKIFNGYMHNTDAYPSSMALKNIFMSHKVFIEECLK